MYHPDNIKLKPSNPAVLVIRFWLLFNWIKVSKFTHHLPWDRRTSPWASLIFFRLSYMVVHIWQFLPPISARNIGEVFIPKQSVIADLRLAFLLFLVLGSHLLNFTHQLSVFWGSLFKLYHTCLNQCLSICYWALWTPPIDGGCEISIIKRAMAQ